MRSTSSTLLTVAAAVVAQVSAATYPNTYNPFNIGNGDAFGIPGNATFDYVVVGGGTAGLAVAYNLAKNSSISVAVIEAGGFYQFENGNQSVVPLYNSQFAALQEPNANPLVDWGFVTTPQAGANNRTLHYARGKTLGGSSALNANIYNRGTNQSFQLWADSVGDQSYTFENWTPYFAHGTNYSTPAPGLRAANASVPQPGAGEFGSSGPVSITMSNYALSWSSWVQKTFASLGFANVTSFSSGRLLGAGYAPSVLQPDTNQRETSETSYLQAALESNRSNLMVYTHTLVTQVLFDNNKTATGVAVKSGRLNYVLSARKEVILSAGAFQSPQLLMVSGIGNATTLAAHNITLIADRPGVGQNMWDHVDVEVTYKVDLITANSLANPMIQQEQLAAYNARPPQSIYGTYSVDFIGWEKLPQPYRSTLSSNALAGLAQFPADWPEIEYEIASVIMSGIPNDYAGYGTFVVIPVSPTSRGTIGLQSASMEDPPIINPNWLTTDTDVELTVQAVKRARDILNSTILDPIKLSKDEYMPGPAIVTDAQLEEYIRNNLFMNWHAACTCKMGRVNDTTAVVDSRARVIGVQKLRVVDASAFAILPPGHPTSMVFGLAEKISANIIEDNGGSYY